MTDAKNHHVIFEGRITGEIGIAEVKRNLAAMFKMNGTQVESLFSGKPIVIKRDIDVQTAQKYAAAFKKAGAVCRIASNDNPTPAGPAAASASAKTAPTTSPAPKPQATDLSRRDIVNIKVPGDLGGLSMGEPGEEIPVLSNEMQADIPDTAGLSVAMDDGYLAPEKNVPEPRVDISNLSIKKDD
jgi:hypothetical protein